MKKKSVERVLVTFISVFLALPELTYPAVEDTKEPRLEAFGYNVKDFGATGDGVTPDTFFIQGAIEKVKADGGGQIYFPPGTYLSGTVYLEDNLTLYLGEGARIIGLPSDHAHYSRRGETIGALIDAHNLEHVSIRGRGIIDGGGVSSGCNSPGCASKSIWFHLCRHVLVEGITVLNGGQTAIELGGSHDVVVRSILLDTNRDGIHISGTNIRISDVVLNSDKDDVLVFKSGFENGANTPTSHVTISNAYVSGYKPGTVYDGSYQEGGGVGRIKFGTESMGGGFRNITINNVIFDRCAGIHMSLVDGGVLENIVISNIVMRDVANSPIYIRLGNRSPARAPKSPPPGVLRNVIIDNLIATGANSQFTSVISGIPGHDVENVTLSNVRITYTGGGTREMASIVPPENEGIYPEPGHFGKIPSYGFYVRHAENIQFQNVVVDFEETDNRPAFVFRDIRDLQLYGIKAERAPSGEPPIEFRGYAEDVQVYNSPSIPTAPVEITRLASSQQSVNPNEGFSAIASANVSEAGLAEVKLLVDDNLFRTRYRWMVPEEPQIFNFEGLMLYQTGEHKLRAGNAIAEISVLSANANFILTDLTASSPWVDDLNVGSRIQSIVLTAQEPAIIQAISKNIGSISGENSIQLSVDGKVVETRTHFLEGGESKEIRFDYTFTDSGEHLLEVNELESRVYAWNKTGEFGVASFQFIPSAPTAGEFFKLALAITDTEYRFGSNVHLYHRDNPLGNQMILARRDQEKILEFNIPPQAAGIHDFTVRNSEGKIQKTISVNVEDRLTPDRLIISSNTVSVNEPLEVSAVIENSYSEEVSMTLGLSVDGRARPSKEISIAPKSSVTISFVERFYELGDHEIAIEGLHPTKVSVTQGQPGKVLEYSGFQISRKGLLPGEMVDTRAKVKNISSEEEQVEVAMMVNDNSVSATKVTLSPGETRDISFNHQFVEEGRYSVSIGDLQALTVQVGLNDIPSRFESQSGGSHYVDVKENPLWVDGRSGKGVQFVWPENWTELSPDSYSRLEASIGPNDLGPAATVSLWYKPNWDYEKRETFRHVNVENHAGFTLFEAANNETKRTFHLTWGDEGEFLSFNVEDQSDRDYEAPDDEATDSGDLGALQNFHANQWYHIAVTWDFLRQPHAIALYVNGQKLAYTEIEGQDFGEFENFTFGAHRHQFQAVGSADGVLDEIRGYNRVLTAIEIQQLFEGTPEVVEGLFFHFSFDE